MPIHPTNADQSLGAGCIPAVYVNQDAGAALTTPFSLIFLARHTDTSGTVVLSASAAGSTAVTLNVAAAGTLEVFGTYSGSSVGATVTLT